MTEDTVPGDTSDETVSRLENELQSIEAMHGLLSPETLAGRRRLLEAINDRAVARGELFIRQVELQRKFSPNHPAILLTEGPPTCLYLRPRFDDPDQGPIQLVFNKCYAASFSPPNDENLHLSPLDPLGFGWWDCVTVGNSPWARLFPWHAVTHYALLLKDHCFHALADGFTESRVDKDDMAQVLRALETVPWQLVGGRLPRRVALS